MDYDSYKQLVVRDIQQTLIDKRYQPVLFIGSGVSKRYAQLPDWHGLLTEIAKNCPLIDKEYTFYKQSITSPIQIGTLFSDRFHEWAWGAGRKDFPKELFDGDLPKDTFMKYSICQYINKKMEEFSIDKLDKEYREEIAAMRSIKPHAVITTNYDPLVEYIFPEYEVIVGQQILHSNEMSDGEIFKIHGSSQNIQSLVINEDDYLNFIKKKKYLTAKLLTLFTEHPLIFIGYRADDPNIKSILSDIDEILAPTGTLIPNIYFLQWDDLAEFTTSNPAERIIPVEDNKHVRIKNITTKYYTWVFEAFASDAPLEQISPKKLRAILARTYELVRVDIPKRRAEVDFSILEAAGSTKEGMAKLYGIGTIGTSSPDVNFTHPFFITAIAEELGFGKNFNAIRQLMARIKSEKGVDIEATDNRYRCGLRTGRRAQRPMGKYSQEAVDLFRQMLAGVDYELKA